MSSFRDDYKAQKEVLRMETQALFPYLIEVTIGDEVKRFANSDLDIVFENNTYKASYFKLSPPERTQTGIKDASITISSLDLQWIKIIRETHEQSSIRFVACIVYADNETYVEPIDDITFKLTNVNWDDTTIKWTMKYDNLLNINMPCVKFTSDICQGLF